MDRSTKIPLNQTSPRKPILLSLAVSAFGEKFLSMKVAALQFDFSLDPISQKAFAGSISAPPLFIGKMGGNQPNN
jgi:hypothetical protein